MEYSFVTHHPCIFINTPMKVLNPEYTRYQAVPALLEVRDKIGVTCAPENVAGIASTAEKMLNGALLPSEEIAAIEEQYAYHIGESGRIGAGYIIRALQERQKNKKASV